MRYLPDKESDTFMFLAMDLIDLLGVVVNHSLDLTRKFGSSFNSEASKLP